MIFGAFERLVAMRYLRARRQEGFISLIAAFSLLGIALGVATLIIVMAVMNGFRHELLTRILGVNGHLSVFARDGAIQDYNALADRIRAVPGVRAATPQIQTQVMVTANERARGGIVRGLKPADLKARALIADNIKAGKLEDFEGQDVVVMGRRLAEQMGTGVGDSVTLVSPSGSTTVIGTVPRLKSYRIAALFDVGMYEYDSSFIYMPLEAAQVFFRLRGAANAVEVFIDDPEDIRPIRWQVDQAAGELYRSYDWQQSNSSFFNAIQVERNVMFLILSLIHPGGGLQYPLRPDHAGEGQGPGYCNPAHHGRDPGHDFAHLLPQRRQHRRHRDGLGIRRGPGLCRKHRGDSSVASRLYRCRTVLGRDLLPVPVAGHRRSGRGRPGGGHGAVLVLPGAPVAGLAGRAPRSGGGAAL